MACFMDVTGTRKNKHYYWCVCDCGSDGHWVSTQGNHSDHSVSHPNALKPGFALSSTKKQYVTYAKPPGGASRKTAATSSSTGSTIAEADLLDGGASLPIARRCATGVGAGDKNDHTSQHTRGFWSYLGQTGIFRTQRSRWWSKKNKYAKENAF